MALLILPVLCVQAGGWRQRICFGNRRRRSIMCSEHSRCRGCDVWDDEKIAWTSSKGGKQYASERTRLMSISNVRLCVIYLPCDWLKRMLQDQDLAGCKNYLCKCVPVIVECAFRQFLCLLQCSVAGCIMFSGCLWVYASGNKIINLC